MREVLLYVGHLICRSSYVLVILNMLKSRRSQNLHEGLKKIGPKGLKIELPRFKIDFTMQASLKI